MTETSGTEPNPAPAPPPPRYDDEPNRRKDAACMAWTILISLAATIALDAWRH